MVEIGGEALEVGPKDIKVLVVLAETAELYLGGLVTVRISVDTVQSFENVGSV